MYYKRGYTELSQEQADKYIEKVAVTLVKQEMQLPAILFLESVKPITRLSASLATITISPWIVLLSDLFGKEEWGQQGYNMLTFFKNKENVSRLINRIEEITEIKKREKEKKKREKKIKEKLNKSSESKTSLKEKIKKFIHR